LGSGDADDAGHGERSPSRGACHYPF
jgi:hypothetical protein